MKIFVWRDGNYCFEGDLAESVEVYGNDYRVRETSFCDNCCSAIVPEFDEPIANCDCCSREWYK